VDCPQEYKYTGKFAFAWIWEYIDYGVPPQVMTRLKLTKMSMIATQIGNWNDIKQYIGTDMMKLSSVASVEWMGDSISRSRAIAAGAITPGEA
jgi:hypothetical protein